MAKTELPYYFDIYYRDGSTEYLNRKFFADLQTARSEHARLMSSTPLGAEDYDIGEIEGPDVIHRYDPNAREELRSVVSLFRPPEEEFF